MDITARLMFPQITVADRDEVLALLGGHVIAEGLAQDNYVEGLRARETEYPTGLDISGGVAIPHTSADYVTGNTLAVATLTRPVAFAAMGDPDTTVEVSTVVMLVFADSQSHVPQLSAVITALQDEAFVTAARAATEPSTLAEILAARFGE